MTKKNIGSSFDDFLREESLLDDVSNEATERVEACTDTSRQKACRKA